MLCWLSSAPLVRLMLTLALLFFRLGGPLVGLLPSPVDPARYLVSQMDNTLRLVNTAAMKVGRILVYPSCC